MPNGITLHQMSVFDRSSIKKFWSNFKVL